MLAFRVESALLYFNVEHVRNVVQGEVDRAGDALRLVVCDLSTSPYVDLAGARMLAAMTDALAKRGIALRLAEAHATTRDLLRAEGLDRRIGGVDRFTSIASAVDRFEDVPGDASGAAPSGPIEPPRAR